MRSFTDTLNRRWLISSSHASVVDENAMAGYMLRHDLFDQLLWLHVKEHGIQAGIGFQEFRAGLNAQVRQEALRVLQYNLADTFPVERRPELYRLIEDWHETWRRAKAELPQIINEHSGNLE